MKDGIDADAFELPAVFFKTAWIGVKIFIGAELGWVDEDRAMTKSVASFAARISVRWPSCKAPIVGTRPIRRPSCFRRRANSCISLTVRKIFKVHTLLLMVLGQRV